MRLHVFRLSPNDDTGICRLVQSFILSEDSVGKISHLFNVRFPYGGCLYHNLALP